MIRGRVRRVVAPAARPIARRWRTSGLRGYPRQPSGWLIGPPDFVGVGAQRAGTKWWYGLICDHPGVQRAAVKEWHFFDRYYETQFTSDDARAYHRRFPRPSGSLTGEWTPRYLHDFWTPPLLQRAAPDAKILVLLRDPLARYLSGLRHELASVKRAVKRYRRPYIEAMDANDALSRSLYCRQLARIFQSFDRSQVLVLQYERCVKAPALELRRTYEFLGLNDPDHVPTFIEERIGKSYSSVDASQSLADAARSAILEDVTGLRALIPEIELDLWPSCRDAGIGSSRA
jgi:hypothetical protein